jgi:hypothetical protein
MRGMLLYGLFLRQAFCCALQSVVDRFGRDIHELGDLPGLERFTHLKDFLRLQLRGSLLPSLIDAALLRCGDAGRLALLVVLQLHLGDAEQHGSHHLADDTGKIDLLRDGDKADALVDAREVE